MKDFLFDDLDVSQEALDLELDSLVSATESCGEDKDDDDDNAPEDVEEKDLDAADEASLAYAALMDLSSPAEISEIVESYEEQSNLSSTFGVAMEKNIVRLDRKARYTHLSTQAAFNLARANNDPNMKKLMKLWAMEKILEKKIQARWGSKARKIANVKIRDYAANGKRIAKPNPSTLSGKKNVTGAIAQRAVNSAKRMFSNGTKINPRK